MEDRESSQAGFSRAFQQGFIHSQGELPEGQGEKPAEAGWKCLCLALPTS
jgi:hypothetical protein